MHFLCENIDVCTRRPDEKDSVVHVEDNVSDVNFNATVYGGQNDKLSRNKDKKYISEVEQSKNDVKENVPNVNKQFHEQQNK